MTFEKLQEDMNIALKEGNKSRRMTLSGLVSAVKLLAIDRKCRGTITEDIVDEAILKEQKKIKEMIETCPKDRVETLEEYERILLVVNEYAPKLIDDEELIEDMICGICTAENIELLKINKGKVMKAIMPQFKGKVDMKIVNLVVARLLQ